MDTLTELFSDPAAQRIGWSLVHFLWQGSAVAIVLAITLALLRHRSAQARWTMSCGALAVMALLPVATGLMVSVEVPGRPESVPAAVTADLTPPPDVSLAPPTRVAELPTESVPPPPSRLAYGEQPFLAPPPPALPATTVQAERTAVVSWPQQLQGAIQPVLPWAILAWLLGVIVMSVWHFGGWLQARRMGRLGTRPAGAAVRETFDRMVQRLRIRRPVRLLESLRAAVPLVVGFVRPVILLPVGAISGLTPQQLEAILAHELAHIRRWDCLVQALQAVMETLLFYHPAVWWVSRRIRQESEQCCDDLAVEICGDRRGYAHALAKVAELGARRPAFAAAATGGKLLPRIRRLLGADRPGALSFGRCLSGALALVTVIAIGIAVGVACSSDALRSRDAASDGVANGRRYDCLLYSRYEVKDGGFAGNTLVAAEMGGKALRMRPLCPVTVDPFAEPKLLTVVRGKAYRVFSDMLVEVDLASGRRQVVAEGLGPYDYHRSGRLYCVQGERLVVFDLARGAFRDIMPRPFREIWRLPVAVSADEKRLAFPEPVQDEKWSKARPLPGAKPQPSGLAEGYWHVLDTRLVIVDLQTGEQTRMPTPFSSPFPQGGGDRSRPAPPLAWQDSTTVLVVRGDRAVKGRPTRGLAAVDINTGEMRDVLAIPGDHHNAPSLTVRQQDGQVRLMLSEGRWFQQAYRMDLKAGRLWEDDQVGPGFRLGYAGRSRFLMHNGNALEGSEGFVWAQASPNGKRIAWSVDEDGPSPRKLRVYDVAAEATQTVSEEFIAGGLTWVADDDLQPGQPPPPPAGWTPLATRPWPEPQERKTPDQPLFADVVAMTLSTDRPTCKHHEQVKLTVTLTNRTDKDLVFPRPADNPFGLGMDYPRGGSAIQEFDRSKDTFPTDPVVIRAGQQFQCTRTIEPYYLGKYVVTGKFRHVPAPWRGPLEPEPITFEVVESADSEQLLKAKFDRLMAICRREYQTDPATCSWSRIASLGPSAAKLLIAELEGSQDAGFRNRMGVALVRMESPDALAFFGNCLTGDARMSPKLAIEGLEGLCQRSVAGQQALTVLLQALGNTDRGIRSSAAESLSRIHDPRVKNAFEAEVGEEDSATAPKAARYLAAYEQLSLADWLAAAAKEPTPARYLAAKGIIAQVKAAWQTDEGELPAVSWKEASGDPEELEKFRRAVAAWETWARRNPSYSFRFFDEDRRYWPKPDAGPTPDTSSTRPATQPGANAAEIERLIQELGSEAFREREASQEALVRMGERAVPSLKAATEDRNAERATRAKAALRKIEDAEEDRKLMALGWGKKGTEGLRIRLVIPGDGNSRPTLSTTRLTAVLEVMNSAPADVPLAEQNTRSGRETVRNEWLLGLQVMVRSKGREARLFMRTDDQDGYWSWADSSFSGTVRIIKPGETARFQVRLEKLADSERRNLLSTSGECELQPLLKVPGQGEGIWCGSADGGWVPVVLNAPTSRPAAPPAASPVPGPATQPAVAGGFTSAVVTVCVDEKGVIHPASEAPTITITDANVVRALAGFFPNLGKGRESPRAAGWQAELFIEFKSPDGKTVKVSVGPGDDGAVWSEGKGDWPVKGDLMAYVARLRKMHQDAATQPSTQSADRSLEELWEAMGGSYEEGLAAARQMAARGDSAVAFLRQQLRPVAGSGDEIARLVTDLGSEKYRTREAATRRLAVLGSAAREALERTPQDAAPEVRERVSALLTALDDPTSKINARSAWAVGVLAAIDTSESATLLDRLARGPGDAWLARRAVAARARLAEAGRMLDRPEPAILEMRIVPTPESAATWIRPQTLTEALESLATKGPSVEVGSNKMFRWFQHDSPLPAEAIVGVHQGKTYVLLWDRAAHLPGSHLSQSDPWEMARVAVVRDAHGAPAVQWELGKHASGHVSHSGVGSSSGKFVALMVGDRILSITPRQSDRLSPGGMLDGLMSAREAQAIVKRLRAGMTPVCELAEAVAAGNAEVVRRILEEHPGIERARSDVRGLYGRTPLHVAIMWKRWEIAQLLIDRGADVNAADARLGRTPLHSAADAGDVEAVRFLIKHRADLEALDKNGMTPLHSAVCEDLHAQAGAALLDAGADVNSTGKIGMTPLTLSVLVSSYARDANEANAGRQCTDLLASRGAKLDVFSAAALGRTEELKAILAADPKAAAATAMGKISPLAMAAFTGQLRAAEMLLESGADPDAYSQAEGIGPPLVAAASRGHADIVKLLLARKADPNAVDKDGDLPIMAAADSGSTEAIKALLAAGVPANAVGKNGRTPLHVAAGRGWKEAVALLLAQGADPRAMARHGGTALHSLCRGVIGTTAGRLESGQAYPACAKALLAGGADVNATDPDGRTPLHWACHRRALARPSPQCDQVVRVLLEADADVNAPISAKDSGHAGKTPILFAAETADAELIKALLDAGADPLVEAGFTSDGQMPVEVAAGMVRVGGREAYELLKPATEKREQAELRKVEEAAGTFFKAVVDGNDKAALALTIEGLAYWSHDDWPGRITRIRTRFAQAPQLLSTILGAEVRPNWAEVRTAVPPKPPRAGQPVKEGSAVFILTRMPDGTWKVAEFHEVSPGPQDKVGIYMRNLDIGGSFRRKILDDARPTQPAAQPAAGPNRAWPKDRPLPAIRIADRTAEPLLKADKPWEACCINYCRVIRTEQGWHMWYHSYDRSRIDDGDSYLCYARSKDGVTWEKPDLGLFEYKGTKHNNVLAYGICGAGVFLDAAAPAGERFKIVYTKQVDGQWWVYGGTSADGLRWKWIEQPLLKRNSDTDTVCIVDGGLYRLYVRTWTGGIYRGRRAVGYAESRTFGGFSEPVTILQPDANDPADMHFYNSAATKLAEGLYLMLPSAFYTSRQVVQPHAALSRDGRSFLRVARGPLLEMGKGFDSKSIYVGAGAVPADRPGEYWVYYLGDSVDHDAYLQPGKVKYAGGIGRFRLILSEP